MDHPAPGDAARPSATAMAGAWLLIALSYVALGRLGLLLAIPPGFATAIFPPAGLSLWVCLKWRWRVLPGVLLGSFLMNLTVSWHPGAGPKAVLLCALIGGGATLQAYVGAWLAHREASDPLDLVTPRDLIRVLLLGGLVACCINASVGVFTLHAFGAIGPSEVPYSWWTWWVGDAIGVALIVPALQMAFSHETLWRRRRLTLGLPLALVTAIVVVVFVRVSAAEERDWKAGLTQRNERVVAEFHGALDARLEVLSGLEGLFRSNPKLDYEQFKRFLDSYFIRHPDIRSMEWTAKVLAKDRAAFEAAMSKTVGIPFRIRGFDPSTRTWLGPRSSEVYYPLTYAAPMDPADRSEGMDLGSIPARLATLERSMDRGEPVLVVWQGLRQDKVRRPVVCATFPIYRTQPMRLTVPERREALLGFVVGIFYADDLLQEALRQSHLMDTGAAFFAPLPTGKPFLAARVGDSETEAGASQSFRFDYLGCPLELRTWPTQAYLQSRRGWQVFLVLAAGLAFTAILGALLLLISGREAQAESLAERRGRALEHLGAQARLILTHAVEPILTLDETGRIEAANAACRRLFGWSKEDRIGHPVSEVLPGLHALLRRTDSSGAMLELQGLHDNGEPIPLEVGFNAVELDDRILFAVFMRDLRERRRVERLKREFIAVVSHELRTPLTSIRGSLSLLEGGVAGELGERAHTLVHLAHENALRLGRLVDDLLDMEKLERAQLKVEIQPAELNDLLVQAQEAHLGYAAQVGVHLDLPPGSGAGLQILGDRGRLLQVLGNLLSNALKLSPRGSTVVLRCAEGEAFVRIEVQDQGPGVPESFRQQIFGKFTQADASERRGVQGTGLGLAIAKALMERMNGTIGYRNEPSGGATFFIDVPLAPVG